MLECNGGHLDNNKKHEAGKTIRFNKYIILTFGTCVKRIYIFLHTSFILREKCAYSGYFFLQVLKTYD